VKPEDMVHHMPMDQLQGFEYCIDSNPSWGEGIALGFQHYILSLGTVVMIPTMLVPLMGGNDVRLQPLNVFLCRSDVQCIRWQ
jgi:hypothetical protein